MPLLSLDDNDLAAFETARKAAIALPAGKPIVIMIHGFRYDYEHSDHMPEHIIYTPHRCRDWPTSASWPLGLGLTGKQGLAIGWSWRARGHIWKARQAAVSTAERLAKLVALLRKFAPDNPIHFFAHSLGGGVLRPLRVWLCLTGRSHGSLSSMRRCFGQRQSACHFVQKPKFSTSPVLTI